MKTIAERREHVFSVLPPFILPFIDVKNKVHECKVLSIPCVEGDECEYYLLCDFIGVINKEPGLPPGFNEDGNNLTLVTKKDGDIVFTWRNLLNYDETMHRIVLDGALPTSFWSKAMVGYSCNGSLRDAVNNRVFLHYLKSVNIRVLKEWNDEDIDPVLKTLEGVADAAEHRDSILESLKQQCENGSLDDEEDDDKELIEIEHMLFGALLESLFGDSDDDEEGDT